MSLFHVKLITPETINEITDLNSGVRPAEETLNNNTFFVYSDDPEIHNEILTRDTFKRDYRYVDTDEHAQAVEKL